MYFLFNRETKQFSNFLCRVDDNCFQMISSSHWSVQFSRQQLPYKSVIELWQAPEYMISINSVISKFNHQNDTSPFILIDSFNININNETINHNLTHFTVVGSKFTFKCKVIIIDEQINLSLPYIYL